MSSGVTNIYSADGKRLVGQVVDAVFYKRIYFSKHLVKKPPSIATDEKSMDAAIKAGAIFLEVTDVETGNTYTFDLERLAKRGFIQDRGYGRQWFILLGDFTRKDAEQ